MSERPGEYTAHRDHGDEGPALPPGRSPEEIGAADDERPGRPTEAQILTPEQEEVIRHHGELWQLDHEALSERCFHAERRVAALEAAGDALVAHYTAMVESGDCGFWDAEQDEPVIAWRAARED